MSASYPPGRFIDLDLADEDRDDYGLPFRPQHPVRRTLLWALVVLACLALGIGLGFLAGKGGDQSVDLPEPAVNREASARSATAAASGGSQTEASRTVERRFAAVAVERATGVVGRGVLASASSLGAGVSGAPGPAGPGEPGLTEAAGLGAPAEAGSDAQVGSADSEAAESALLPVSEAVATEPTSEPEEPAASPDEDRERDRERAREPRPDRWSDPNVEPVDYDFSVPFEQREERSRERLLRIDQSDPYAE